MDRSAALLSVTADQPGKFLAVEGQRMTLDGLTGGFVGGAFGALLGATGAAHAESLWRTWRLRADRAAGVLAIDEFQPIGGEERSESIALADVAKLQIRSVYLAPSPYDREAPPFSPVNPRHVEAVVHVRDDSAPRTIGLDVLGIDTLDKVADLAFRLGAAMGLRSQRVARSDPRRIEIELHAAEAPGAEAAPVPKAAADYVGGRVAPAAVETAARQRISPFDPAGFPSDFRSTRWSPGEEVRFDKPLEGPAYGCLPVAIAGLLLGPGLWLLFRDVAHTVITMLIVSTLVGLVVSAVAVSFVASSLPRQVRISWLDGTVTVGGPLSRRRVPLHGLAALELQCVRSTRGGTGGTPYNVYQCRLSAHLRGEAESAASPWELVSTKMFEREPEPPYDAALPLANDLAAALGIPWTLTDYA